MSEKTHSGTSSSSSGGGDDIMQKKSSKSIVRSARSPETADRTMTRNGSWKAGCDVSLGGVIASCRRRGTMSTVFKTLGMRKVEPTTFHVNVGKDKLGRFGAMRGASAGKRAQRTLGVSLLGACSSKGCPTKSDENEDRYVHGKISLDLGSFLQDGDSGEDDGRNKSAPSAVVPCWAFATFDGHAGPACAHFLRENFMLQLRKCTEARRMAGGDSNASSPSPNAQGNADAAAGTQDEAETTSPKTEDESDSSTAAAPRKGAPMEMILARLLTDTLASLTRAFEKSAVLSGEISGACVISGLYCEGALVLANIGDCQAVYHGQVKSAPGAAVTAQTTIHDASNQAEVNRFLKAGGFMSATGRFQGVLEPSRTVGDVDVKADAPKGCIASYPELFKVDIASELFRGEEHSSMPPFLVLATDGIWDETSADTVVEEVKDGITKIQAHKRRFAISEGHRRDSSFGSTTFTDGESDSENEESEFCGSGEWAEQGMDLAERVVSLARGRYDDATALVVVFE